MATNECSLDPEIINQFHGSEHWYRHWVSDRFHRRRKICRGCSGSLLAPRRNRPRTALRQSRRRRRVSGMEADGQTGPQRHPLLRGRQLQCRLQQGDRVYRLPVRGHHPLVREQDDLLAERALTTKPRLSDTRAMTRQPHAALLCGGLSQNPFSAK